MSEIDKVKKGDRYVDDHYDKQLIIDVVRVAKDGSWADIHVYQPHTGAAWTKRQPTPIPGRKVS